MKLKLLLADDELNVSYHKGIFGNIICDKDDTEKKFIEIVSSGLTELYSSTKNKSIKDLFLKNVFVSAIEEFENTKIITISFDDIEDKTIDKN